MFYQPFLVLFLMSYIKVATPASDTISQEVIICEGKYNKIVCPEKMKMRILSAFYGNVGYSVCGSMRNIECYNPKALAKVHKTCHKKQECILVADNGILGDNCPAGNNHLRVGFTCKK
ncbi:L-rhamnose-binding lectin ELEL-1-like [Aethina tumida]|uniref:L-rhamnose-binding lectin ELEL-1-like n=1 Tax=Aethina tumida TaxID=116153 RepID=UPI0021474A32|nr:L-rhamnose-binding lectin ELEL-1-like [Aethina tumida]